MFFLILVIFWLGFLPNIAYAQTWEKSGLTEYRIQALETTPWGIFAGEYDQRLWINPYNGVFLTRNLGKSWENVGLEKRGITDLAYSNGKIYASTFYFNENIAGLFISSDSGNTWQHAGGGFSASKVSASDSTVVLGTFSHGLWVSLDEGSTWEQKLGDGFYGPKINETASFENIHLASTQNQTYISRDGGTSWSVISSLNDYIVSNIEVVDSQTIFVGTNNTSGMFVSNDGGYSWANNSAWGNNQVGAIKEFEEIIYAGRQNQLTNKYDIYKSENSGITWQPTDMLQIYNAGQVLDIAEVFSAPSLLFATAPLEGALKYKIPPKQIEAIPFLSPPWELGSDDELIEGIYSFFDHEFPIYYLEPENSKADTLNFLGRRESEPDLFYSGHDGYDFSVSYGTPVLAAAEGLAQYQFDSQGLGNSITIFHDNGLKTVYGHLQYEGLITSTETFVNEGDQIGLTGLSGNTTGPHIHFAVESPDGVLDPFGWQTKEVDPWKQYSGIFSKYLWKILPNIISQFIENSQEIILGNKKLIIEQNSVEDNVTVFLQPYAKPRIPISQNSLTYVTSTSFLVNMYNILGQETPLFLKPITIEIDLSNTNFEEFNKNSLKIYFWNESTQLWESIPTILDDVTKVLSGQTTHFSKYAVFGEKLVKKLRIENMTFVVI